MRFSFVLLIACVTAGACGAAGPVTFNKDVAPIVFANCASCHRPGGDAPFSLLTYADVARHATAIAEQTRARHMPPWLPEPGDVPISGVRRLSAEQIDTIQQWVRAGAVEGAPQDLPALPTFSSDWQLGTPDAVLEMSRPYVLTPGDTDVYRNVVLPNVVPDDVFVRAVELRTNGSPIHHALIRVAPASVARRRDGEGGQAGFDGMSAEGLQDPPGQFLGWAPGRGPMQSPDGMPWRLARGTDLVVELHMIPSDRPVEIRPSVALYFSRTPPARVPVTAMMVSKQIDIPAGDANYVVADRYELPVPVELIGLFPHAHYLGKEMLVTAKTPGASAPTTLLHIKHWSFHWQQDYRYVTPVPLPKGTVIDLRFTYDNSAGNPDNPHHPPARVRVGSQSTDEMANLGLQLLTASPADTTTLLASFFRRDVLANIAAGEAGVRESPNSVTHRVQLGSSYLQAGRFADAVPHLQHALRLEPRHAVAESLLGGAYMSLGRVGEALPHFQRSAQLAPDDERAQLNLAGALEKSGRRADAMAAYRRAVAIESFEAHVGLTALLVSAGNLKAALTHLRRIVAIRPNSADAQSDLGAVLADLGQRDEAIRSLRKALELDPNHAQAREHLARLTRGRE